MSHGGSEEVTDTGVEATSDGRARGRERGGGQRQEGGGCGGRHAVEPCRPWLTYFVT
jgi:hypothetical protein